jgi:hypothetical protein
MSAPGIGGDVGPITIRRHRPEPAMLPTWMRRALLATAVMNGSAAIAFLPFAAPVRALMGMPLGEHPVYLTTVALFVFLFGVGYLLVGLSGRPERLFIALSAAGKLGFVTIVGWYWLSGVVPFKAFLVASGDLPFGVLFATWLFTTRVEQG